MAGPSYQKASYKSKHLELPIPDDDRDRLSLTAAVSECFPYERTAVSPRHRDYSPWSPSRVNPRRFGNAFAPSRRPEGALGALSPIFRVELQSPKQGHVKSERWPTERDDEDDDVAYTGIGYESTSEGEDNDRDGCYNDEQRAPSRFSHQTTVVPFEFQKTQKHKTKSHKLKVIAKLVAHFGTTRDEAPRENAEEPKQKPQRNKLRRARSERKVPRRAEVRSPTSASPWDYYYTADAESPPMPTRKSIVRRSRSTTLRGERV